MPPIRPSQCPRWGNSVLLWDGVERIYICGLFRAHGRYHLELNCWTVGHEASRTTFARPVQRWNTQWWQSFSVQPYRRYVCCGRRSMKRSGSALRPPPGPDSKDRPAAPAWLAHSINCEHWARNSKITKLVMFLPILLRQSESSFNIFLLSVTRAFHEGYWILFKHIVLTKWLSQFCPSMYSSTILLHTVTGGRVKFWKTNENLTVLHILVPFPTISSSFLDHLVQSHPTAKSESTWEERKPTKKGPERHKRVRRRSTQRAKIAELICISSRASVCFSWTQSFGKFRCVVHCFWQRKLGGDLLANHVVDRRRRSALGGQGITYDRSEFCNGIARSLEFSHFHRRHLEHHNAIDCSACRQVQPIYLFYAS